MLVKSVCPKASCLPPGLHSESWTGKSNCWNRFFFYCDYINLIYCAAKLLPHCSINITECVLVIVNAASGTNRFDPSENVVFGRLNTNKYWLKQIILFDKTMWLMFFFFLSHFSPNTISALLSLPAEMPSLNWINGHANEVVGETCLSAVFSNTTHKQFILKACSWEAALTLSSLHCTSSKAMFINWFLNASKARCPRFSRI